MYFNEGLKYLKLLMYESKAARIDIEVCFMRLHRSNIQWTDVDEKDITTS